MKRFFVFLAAVLLVFGVNDLQAQCHGSKKASDECIKHCDEKQAETPTMTSVETIDRGQLSDLLNSGTITLVDARNSNQYAQGHIEGAINLASGAELPEDKNAELVFYCGSSKCQLAPKAAREAVDNGYTNVRVFHDGWAGWASAEETK
jgi:rhodanese-related sulfurtransferase